MRLIKPIHPVLTSVTLATCLAGCPGDDTGETADGGSTGEATDSTTSPSTTLPSTTAPSTTSVDTGTDTNVDSSTGTETGTDTESDTDEPYALAPNDKNATTDLLDVHAAPGTTTTIGFTWNETAGWPAATDLSVHVAGDRKPLAQVFTSARAPFVRTGLEVVPLVAGTEYQLVVTLGHDHTATVQVRQGDTVLVTQTVEVSKKVEISGLELRMPAANMLAAPVGLDEISVE